MNEQIENLKTEAQMSAALDLLRAADLILGQTLVHGVPFYDMPIDAPASLRAAIEDLDLDLDRFRGGDLA